MQPVTVVNHQQPYVTAAEGVGLPSLQVKQARGLGIAQIVIGSLVAILNGVAIPYFNNYFGSNGVGVILGIWVTTGGILGTISASFPKNSCLNTTNMIFAIISSIACGIGAVIACVGISALSSNCGNLYFDCKASAIYDAYLGVYVSLLALFAAEFGVSISAAIYCGKATSCCGSQPGAIIHTAQPLLITSSAACAYQMQSSVPCSAPPMYAYSNAGLVFSTQQFGMQPNQVGKNTTAGIHQQINPTAMTYNQEVVPNRDDQQLVVELPPPY